MIHSIYNLPCHSAPPHKECREREREGRKDVKISDASHPILLIFRLYSGPLLITLLDVTITFLTLTL